jgi:SAM-dependent methyltransferase
MTAKSPTFSASALVQPTLSNRSAGDFATAHDLLLAAVRKDRRNADLRLQLAVCAEKIGAIDQAARELTEVLRLNPRILDAARRLSSLLGRHKLTHPRILEPFGLQAALAFETIDKQPLVDAAFCYLASAPPLGPAVLRASRGESLEAARDLILHKTSEALQSALLLAALEHGLNRSVVFESLLAALRRTILIELAAPRFNDRALVAFALALIHQLMNNEYVWPVSSQEQIALSHLTIDAILLRAGDFEAGRRLLLHALYRPPIELLGTDVAAVELQRLRPKSLRLFVQHHLAAWSEERALAAGLRRLGKITEPTSIKVAKQYEAHPYPRWLSLQTSGTGTARSKLARFFAPATLNFMDQPFDVLIAGAGTCQHAIGSAVAYGRAARVLAIDLSAASLAYGKRMAARLDVRNIEFVVADILDSAELNRKFEVIESVGVLHHMAAPFKAWRKLLNLLKPRGIMYVGVYSGIARESIAALRVDDLDFPGADCDNDAARRYRSDLLRRAHRGSAMVLHELNDFYSLSGFRDLVLHPHEVGLTLPEISRFLAENELQFRGFIGPAAVMRQFGRAFPRSPWPGDLNDWARFETATPRTFEGMYQFWVEHVPG